MKEYQLLEMFLYLSFFILIYEYVETYLISFKVASELSFYHWEAKSKYFDNCSILYEHFVK